MFTLKKHISAAFCAVVALLFQVMTAAAQEPVESQPSNPIEQAIEQSSEGTVNITMPEELQNLIITACLIIASRNRPGPTNTKWAARKDGAYRYSPTVRRPQRWRLAPVPAAMLWQHVSQNTAVRFTPSPPRPIGIAVWAISAPPPRLMQRSWSLKGLSRHSHLKCEQ